MRLILRSAGIALALLLAAGVAHAGKRDKAPTAPGTYHDWNGDLDEIEIVETFDLEDYDRLVVGTFDTADTPLPDEDDNSYAPAKQVLSDVETSLIQGLKEAGGGLSVVRQEGDAPAEAGTLLLRGRVVEMDPGSRSARYWAGFGAGAARAKLSGELVDAASGRVLLRFTQERRSGVGMGGGGYVELLNRNLRAIGEDLGAGLQRF
jgi:hypothetical protein